MFFSTTIPFPVVHIDKVLYITCMIRYMIIGAGAAGLEAALAIRKIDTESPVTIVTDEDYAHYSRPRLVHFLAEEGPPEALQTYDAAWYESKGIEIRKGRRIVGLDLQGRSVADDRGEVLPWDRLLLACGGLSAVPGLPGVGRPGVFSVRKIVDTLAIRAYSSGRRRAVVIGGGLLGLESAYALVTRGMEVTVVETAPWLLPRQLDAEGGAHLQRLLEAKGLSFVLGDQAASLGGAGAEGPVEAVTLKTGAVLPADLVLFSIGVRPEASLAAAAGLKIGRGVVVDDHLETSAPGVFAAGDVAEHRGLTYGLWPVSREQGRIAGTNMAGGSEEYRGSLPSSQLKITGIEVYSAGDVSCLSQSDAEERTIGGRDELRYRKLVVGADGGAVAAMVIGDRSAVQIARRVMSGSADPGEFASP